MMPATAAHPLYSNFDPDSYDTQSLCLDCAKHPSLKGFIERNGAEGPVCGICQHVADVYRCCDLAKKDQLTNVLKALIRLYYNEYEYNAHWGGDDEPEGLLVRDNPILEHQSTPLRTRIPDRSTEFLYDLLSRVPYPDPDQGISLYAGHDAELGRMMQLSLRDSDSPRLKNLALRLVDENYFDVEPELLMLLDSLLDRITRIISRGTRYFRARIGVEAKFLDLEALGFLPPIARQPFSGKALGAPPPLGTSAGRLNRNGVSFLYLSSDAMTAACEVRPHPGHFLSVGEFESNRDLRIATFDADISRFARSEDDLGLFHFILSADKIIGSPVVPEHTRRYTITQLIAECIRQKGLDGLSFRSSVGTGQNICVFQPSLFAPIDESVTVQEVTSLSYSLEPVPTIIEPTARHSRIGPSVSPGRKDSPGSTD